MAFLPGTGNVTRLAARSILPRTHRGGTMDGFEGKVAVITGGASGLGLAIVASIVSALHGTVVVEETPGGGATFRVSLPLASPGEPLVATRPIDVSPFTA